jgi:hypothetical protein
LPPLPACCSEALAQAQNPVISNVYPDGAYQFQPSATLSFTASSAAGIDPTNITVQLTVTSLQTGQSFIKNLTSVSGLTIGGTPTNRSVSAILNGNTLYSAAIHVIDGANNSASSGVSFDTISGYTFEAEDYDYTSNGISGLFFDGPQVDACANLPSTAGIDNFQSDHDANPFLYRNNSIGLCPSTKVSGDGQRPQFAGGKTDYNIGLFGGGSWCNYTRHYPAGTYEILGRFAEGASSSEIIVSRLTGGYGTTNQTSNVLGTFFIPYSGGWSAWEWAWLTDSHGSPVKAQFDGSQTTLKLAGSPVGGQPEVNVNFVMLVPETPNAVTLGAAINGASIAISVPTQAGFSYQVEYKTNLKDASWIPLGTALTGNGAVQFIDDAIGGSGSFYRVQIQ